jgi:hypothetical protein
MQTPVLKLKNHADACFKIFFLKKRYFWVFLMLLLKIQNLEQLKTMILLDLSRHLPTTTDLMTILSGLKGRGLGSTCGNTYITQNF